MPAKEITLYRYLLFSALGLVLITIAGFLVGMELKESSRILLVMNNRISRIQTDASMHLVNYAQSGHVRDLQKFRSATSPLIDLAEAVHENGRTGNDNEAVMDAFMQVGLNGDQASRMNLISNYSDIAPFPHEEPEPWEQAMTYHYRMFDLSRQLLRDHVHAQMTTDRIRRYVEELQELNREIMEYGEILGRNLADYEARIDRFTKWPLGGAVVFGFLFIAYAGFSTEKSWKHRERVLRRSSNRYQEMFEQAGIGIAQVSPDGRLLWANPAIARILGYDSVNDLFTGLGLFERNFVDPERKSDFKTGLTENGFVTNFMFRAFRKDQKKIWLLCNARMVEDDQKRIVCYEASYQDYTLYRQTNQELHFLTAILRGMAQSIYQLLLTREFDEAVNEFLKIIGKAGSIDRVYIYRNYEKKGEPVCSLEYEWVKYESLSILYESATRNVKLRALQDDIENQLVEGNVVQKAAKELEGAAHSFMKKLKTRVVMLAPVYAEDRFWGVIGFDNCSNDDKWNGDIVQVFKTLARALGHFVHKTEVEASLVNSKNQYRTLVGSIKEIVFQTDQEGIIQYLNPAWETVTNYPVSESIGRNIHDFIHLEDRRNVKEAFDKMVKKKEGNARNEYRLITRKGAVRWLEWTCLFIKDSQTGTPYIYGTMHDLTKRKKVETTMMQNNQRLEALIESSPMAIAVNDTDGKLTLWNHAAEQTYGWNRKEVLGKPSPEVPENRQREHYDLLDKVLSGEYLKSVELERKRKDGSKIYISLSAAPLYDSDGKVEQVITFAHDISEAKVSRETIRKSLKEKNVLLSEIHHRVKNNMAVISSLLSLKAQEQTDPKISELLMESENRIKSMAMIHEKLYQTDTFAEIEFGSYLNELAMHIAGHYDGLDAEVTIDIRAEEVYLEITQAVPCGLLANEMLTNGYKHAFPGYTRGTIEITFSLKGDICELYYKDDGVGLPDEVISGHGDVSLGLNLIQGLSKQMKGELEMGNDNGAYYRLTFPLM